MRITSLLFVLMSSAVMLFSLSLKNVEAQDHPCFADFLGVADISGVEGSNIVVPVIVTNTNTAIPSIVFGMHYDKAVLSLVSVNLGKLTASWGDPAFNDAFAWGTVVTIVYTGEDPIPASSTGAVVELTFTILGSSGSSSHLNFYDLNALPVDCTEIFCGVQFSDTEYNLGTANSVNSTFTSISQSWITANQITISWDAVATLGNGDSIPESDLIEYIVYLSDAVGDPDKTNPIEVETVNATSCVITLTDEGYYFAGLRTIRKLADGTPASESIIGWSDDPFVVLEGNTFGIRYFLPPAVVRGLMPSE